MMSTEVKNTLITNKREENDIHVEENQDQDTQIKSKGRCANINFGVYILVALFGVSSWICVNGVFMEQPLLVASLPEGWKLPSYLAVAVQIGNISIFITTCLHQKYSERRHQIIVIYVMISVSIVAVICIAFFWERTSEIAGANYSVPLIFLVFVLSLASCSSSVVFLPFMANFQSQYINAFFLGEGMSGLIPSVMALIQGGDKTNCRNITVYNDTSNSTYQEIRPVKEPSTFGVTVHVLIIGVITIISLISFSFLNFSKFCKNARVSGETVKTEETLKLMDIGEKKNMHNEDRGDTFTEIRNGKGCDKTQRQKERRNGGKTDARTPLLVNMSKMHYGYYLAMTSWINALEHGILLSIQTYATLPYGRQTYHLSVVLSNIVDPVACFTAEFVPQLNIKATSILTFLGSLISAYLVFLASWSPSVITIDIKIGSALAILSWIVVVFILTFAKVCIAAIIRNEGKKALLWCGVSKQVGASVGAALLYILINVFHVFKSSPPCEI